MLVAVPVHQCCLTRLCQTYTRHVAELDANITTHKQTNLPPPQITCQVGMLELKNVRRKYFVLGYSVNFLPYQLLPVKATFPLLNVLPEGSKLMHINGTISVEVGGRGKGRGGVASYPRYTHSLSQDEVKNLGIGLGVVWGVVFTKTQEQYLSTSHVSTFDIILHLTVKCTVP